MSLAARRFLLSAICLALPGVLFAQKSASKRASDMEHIREELGVNEFTAPSIDLIFDQLESLKPISFDKAWRNLPETTPQDRARLALCAGQVIADGFLAVSAHKQSRIEPVGRVLLKLARGLGVGDPITKHSKSLIELAAREKWPEIRRELIKAQAEVEAGMMALKDEEIAHLVSLGGWMRGLEMTASIAIEGYTPERARAVIQPELFDYYSERLETLNPNLKKSGLFITINKNIAAIRAMARKPAGAPVELSELKQIRDLAREINKAVVEP